MCTSFRKFASNPVRPGNLGKTQIAVSEWEDPSIAKLFK